MKNQLLIWGAFLVVAAGGQGCGSSLETADEASASFADPVPASAFSIPSLTKDTKTVSMEQHKGKVILLDFWATWCPPCRYELPALNQLYTELNNESFVLIGMTVDAGSVEAVAKAVSPFKLAYPVGLAGEEVQAAYGGIRAVPTKFLIDKKGRIRKQYMGLVSDVTLRSEIDALLKEEG